MRNSFNSFEDETIVMQYHWCHAITFQFLWGWNIAGYFNGSSVEGVNFQFLCGWNLIILWYQLEYRNVPFNSFEDETYYSKYIILLNFYPLSIPLRMKLNEQGYLKVKLFNFQFLWGWDPVYYFNAGRKISSFQFLWGWNPYSASLPSGSVTVTFQFLWGWNIEKVIVELS